MQGKRDFEDIIADIYNKKIDEEITKFWKEYAGDMKNSVKEIRYGTGEWRQFMLSCEAHHVEDHAHILRDLRKAKNKENVCLVKCPWFGMWKLEEKEYMRVRLDIKDKYWEWEDVKSFDIDKKNEFIVVTIYYYDKHTEEIYVLEDQFGSVIGASDNV